MQHTREVPGSRTEARWEAGGAHGALNCTNDRDKYTRRVFFMIKERKLKVEESAQGNIASLAPRSIAGEDGLHLDKMRIALGEQTEKNPS